MSRPFLQGQPHPKLGRASGRHLNPLRVSWFLSQNPVGAPGTLQPWSPKAEPMRRQHLSPRHPSGHRTPARCVLHNRGHDPEVGSLERAILGVQLPQSPLHAGTGSPAGRAPECLRTQSPSPGPETPAAPSLLLGSVVEWARLWARTAPSDWAALSGPSTRSLGVFCETG